MKYAFIVLVACYLLVWGCGPDNSKKADEQKSQVTQSKVEKTPAPAPTPEAAKPTPLPEKPAVAAATKAQEQPPPAPEQAAATPVTPSPAPAQPAQIEKAPMPCDMTAKHPAPVAETEEQQLVTLPCGMVVPKEMIPADAPCFHAKIPCPMMHGRQNPPVDEMASMPCGRPCFRHPALPMGHPDIYGQERGQLPEPLTDAEDEPAQDLAAAMQKMVETTNDMVVVTRQLVVATQEMVRATQDAAYHVQQPQTVAPVQVEPEPTKHDATSAMHEAVLATQKALEALNQVLPKVLEPRQ